MILVLLGTHELPFTRLIKEVEKLKKKEIIADEVVVQNGKTPYTSDVLTLKPFVSYDEMDRLVEKADYIITHAGTGSIISGLKKGKKVIAVPRLKKYGEHNDDHQLEIAGVFEEQGHILVWHDGENLEDVIAKLANFEPKPFQSKKEKLMNLLKEFIDSI